MQFRCIFALLTLLLNVHHFLSAEDGDDRTPTTTLDTYIVHVEANPQIADDEGYYESFMPNRIADSEEEQPVMVHKYHNVMSGFAAKLSAADVETMRQKPGFITAHREQIVPLLTTHSQSFMGLIQNLGVWNASNYGKGVIIGVLDTGIAPEHPSFSDEGLSPPPAKWKGKCELSRGCNNKLIGARGFGKHPPLDDIGHGSHTASTAAGNFVPGANLYGNANGTAVGVAPLAHVAVYKVCNADGCKDSDIIAGMDAAVGDGVDILSMSLGGKAGPYYSDAIAIGTYKATELGVLVSCSAGNSGPGDSTVSNVAPWILTVGASSIDRKLGAFVELGNNRTLFGQSAFQPKEALASTTELEIVFPGISPNAQSSSRFCDYLEADAVAGKIVVCEVGTSKRLQKGKMVRKAGGAAMILMNTRNQGGTTNAEAHVLPAAHIGYQEALKLVSYLNSTSRPTAKLTYDGTIIGDKHAPIVGSFSSRGPNSISPGILKPDVIGPGLNILAAWPFSVGDKSNNSKSTFNTNTGTSMSCPHLSGIAALIKSAHPDWSPAAIKSAIMTTADQVNLGGMPILDEKMMPANVFATGAGHVNPSRAIDPGLVYDIDPKDYISYMCGLGFTNHQVSIVALKTVDCSKESKISEGELNYPSFSLVFGAPTSPKTYSRTVTNVGEANSSYDVKIVPPVGVDISVEPSKLNFSKVNEKLSYKVSFSRSKTTQNTTMYGQGSISWISAKHVVRSPVAVVFK